MTWAQPSIHRYALCHAYSFCVACRDSFAQWDSVGSSVSQGLAENCKLHHQLEVERQSQHGVGRGNPDCRWKQLPISLGFKCAYCGGEFGSRSGMDCHWHRRHHNPIGTPCADLMNSESMSFTGRADQSAGIPRQHDILGENQN